MFVIEQVIVGAAEAWLHLSFLRHLRDHMIFVMTLSPRSCSVCNFAVISSLLAQRATI